MENIFSESTNINTTSISTETARPSYQAFQILRGGFAIAPIMAGVDKFFNLLVNWDKYLPSFVSNMTSGNRRELMYLVGSAEIAADVGVCIKPRIFACVVAAWLFLIIVNLLMFSSYLDIVMRDFGLALGAIVLRQSSQEFSKQAVEKSRQAAKKSVHKYTPRVAE